MNMAAVATFPSHRYVAGTRHHRSEPATQKPRKRLHLGLQASLAELMLVTRLRARNRSDLAVDTLERAAKVIEVTSKHWFGKDAGPVGSSGI